VGTHPVTSGTLERLPEGRPAPTGRTRRRAAAAERSGGSVYSRMTKFVVDCGVVLHLASEGIEVPAEHELLAPTLLRSQTLSALHEAVHGGEIPPDVALDRLTRIRAIPIRLLGDAVLRRRAWDLAEQLGWAETYDAEYVALTQLQADAFVTLDAELARRAEAIVPTATIEALRTA
jgi:predicted nucleic acid-binding protein